jgi:nucleoside-diphosphate-sugar epimerase
MVRILVTGANGYIGSAVAAHLRSRGHTVFGLIRNEKYSNQLLQHEVLPVIGNFDDTDSWKKHLQTIGVIIDTVSPHGDTAEAKIAPHLAAAHALADLAKATHTARHYIYTSGCLVYGEYGSQVVDETFETRQPGFEWRMQLEQQLVGMNTPRFYTSVIRPGWVYGLSWGGYLSSWFRGNDKGEIEVFGKADKVSMPHMHSQTAVHHCISCTDL